MNKHLDCNDLLYVIERDGFKEVIRSDKSLFMCPFCAGWFKGLAYHTVQKHGVTSKHLKLMLGVKSNYQLVTPDIKDRHREIAIDNNEGEKLKRVGLKTRFNKGFEGHIDSRWSVQAKRELGERTKNMMLNKRCLCDS